MIIYIAIYKSPVKTNIKYSILFLYIILHETTKD